MTGIVDLNMKPGLTAINKSLFFAHAEVGVMYQAYLAGERDSVGKLIVAGLPICFFCRIDTKKLAIAMNLCSFEVYDCTGIYIFDRKDLNPIYKGGKSWSKAMSKS